MRNRQQLGLRPGRHRVRRGAEAQRVAERLDTGHVGINTYLRAPIQMPFGGTKHSGVGRELGRSGLDQYANIKTYGIA